MQEHPVRAYRRERNLTLEALAAKVKTSAATLSRVEAGDLWPAPLLMRRLIEALEGEVTADAILASVKREPPSDPELKSSEAA